MLRRKLFAFLAAAPVAVVVAADAKAFTLPDKKGRTRPVTPSNDLIEPGDIGTIKAWVGAEPPAGHLWCHGQMVGRAQYPELYRIFNFYDDGRTTFAVPDFRGYMVGHAMPAMHTHHVVQPTMIVNYVIRAR